MDSDGSIEITVVGAIRIAFEGGADDHAILTLTRWLLDQAPGTPSGDTKSVHLLLEGIRAVGGSLSMESPSGAYTSVG